MRRASLLAVVLAVILSRPAMASDFTEFLHQLFDEHVGREPTGIEVNQYAGLNRSQGLLGSYVALFASEEYFAGRCQRNYEVYVRNLYRVFLMRDPRVDELRFWVNQFAQGGADRVTVLRRFLEANRVSQLPSFPPSQQPPVFRPPGRPAEIASQLVSETRLFDETIRRDLGGTRYGRVVSDRAVRLQTVALQYQDLWRARNVDSNQLRIALGNVESAYRDLEVEFNRVPSASPVGRDMLWRISQLVSAARQSVESSVGRPPDSGLLTGVETLRERLRQFAYGLQYYQNRGPVYSQLLRDVQGLAVQLDGLSLMIRQGASRRSQRRTAESMLTQAAAVTRQVENIDLTIQRGWWDIQRQLQTIANNLGAGSSWTTAGRPVIIPNPSWPQLGYQPTPDSGNLARNREIVNLCDQLLAGLDDYVRSLEPLARRSRDADRLRDALKDLAHDVEELRQEAARGKYGRQLEDEVEDVLEEYQDTAKRFTEVVTRDPTLNSPNFLQVGALVEQIRRAARGEAR